MLNYMACYEERREQMARRERACVGEIKKERERERERDRERERERERQTDRQTDR